MEALILFFVLFFPGIYSIGLSGGAELAESIHFETARELGRILSYTLPSLALLWYIMSDKKGFSALKQEKLKKQDFFSFAVGLPGLIIIGLSISVLVTFISLRQGMTPPPRVEAPLTVWGWSVMVFSCLGTGYLEESYFRYYLLTMLENQLPGEAASIFFSTVLFSLCHIYEGPWGVLNAAFAGLFLSAIFIRYRALHGIAWAHGAYNIFVYVMGNFVS